jgi:hypothetical protein
LYTNTKIAYEMVMDSQLLLECLVGSCTSISSYIQGRIPYSNAASYRSADVTESRQLFL